MARTKASAGAKISSGKSSKARCTVAPTPSSNGSSGSSERSSKNSGGNPVCPRETPKWQRPITNFFINKTGTKEVEIESDNEDEEAAAGTSKFRPRRNIIESDNEDEIDVEKPKNTELDETIVLEPLDGENNHKISEYYPKNEKNENEVGSSANEDGSSANGSESDSNGMKNATDEVKSDTKRLNSDANSNEADIKGKGKGKGKKTNKENVSDNIERRKSVKRDLDENGDVDHVSKKVKVT